MADYYKVDTISRVQAVLETRGPNKQIIRISEVEDMTHVQVRGLTDFPDEPVRNGTRIYQIFRDGRIFEICVLRG